MAAVPKNISGADEALYAGQARIYGWSIANTHASDAATIVFYDAASATGNVLGRISLAAGASSTIWFGPQGVYVGTGIYADVAGTGTLAGSVYVG